MKVPNMTQVLAALAGAAAHVPGAAEPIAAAAAVIDLIKSIRPLLTEAGAAELDAALPALLEQMNLDVDQAMQDLRGG